MDEDLKRRFPTIADLRAHGRKKSPRFAFDYVDGGAGLDGGIARNNAALDAITYTPRYGVIDKMPALDVELFGRRYKAPIGICPVGGSSIVHPGAERFIAAAAQAAGVPHTSSVVSGTDIETLARLAPDVFWLQLYRHNKNDFQLASDFMRRGADAGAHVLVLTIDSPSRTIRTRETRSGIGFPVKFRPRHFIDVALSPQWLAGYLRYGMPTFANLRAYVRPGAPVKEIAAFAATQSSGGAFLWDEVARFRDKWKKPMAVKGIMHPEDAEKAVSLGIEGIWVSNHGGRQVEAMEASIDVLPAVARAVGSKATIVFDSGVRSGLDVARALALGANAAFVGKAMYWSVAALAERGPAHALELLKMELQAAVAQAGATSLQAMREVDLRHPGAVQFAKA